MRSITWCKHGSERSVMRRGKQTGTFLFVFFSLHTLQKQAILLIIDIEPFMPYTYNYSDYLRIITASDMADDIINCKRPKIGLRTDDPNGVVYALERQSKMIN